MEEDACEAKKEADEAIKDKHQKVSTAFPTSSVLTLISYLGSSLLSSHHGRDLLYISSYPNVPFVPHPTWVTGYHKTFFINCCSGS